MKTMWVYAKIAFSAIFSIVFLINLVSFILINFVYQRIHVNVYVDGVLDKNYKLDIKSGNQKISTGTVNIRCDGNDDKVSYYFDRGSIINLKVYEKVDKSYRRVPDPEISFWTKEIPGSDIGQPSFDRFMSISRRRE